MCGHTHAHTGKVYKGRLTVDYGKDGFQFSLMLSILFGLFYRFSIHDPNLQDLKLFEHQHNAEEVWDFRIFQIFIFENILDFQIRSAQLVKKKTSFKIFSKSKILKSKTLLVPSICDKTYSIFATSVFYLGVEQVKQLWQYLFL